MSTFVNTSIPEMPIREFGSKYNKNIHKAPLIITKGKKRAFIVLPYADYEAIQQSFSTPPPGQVHLVSDDRREGTLSPVEHVKLSLLDRLKKLLTVKIF